MNVLTICGSLRKDSYNRKLLAVATKALEVAGATVTEAPIGDIPLYNEDLDVQPWPAAAQRFFDQVAAANAILIVSPEYNFSIPGGLKNAIDWASRGDVAWKNSVIALMGASTGPYGTARGQMHVRQALLGTDTTWVIPQPQVCVGLAGNAFNGDGTLKDPKMNERVTQLVARLLELAPKLKENGSR
ncbi:MAG TPA: NADPH-dependent FMN reductase [Candidatus Paceibacterota bacterium]|nr:NADPH-dependent FMN reductase [Candidatus Paceibacterota bacterium]